MHCFHPVCSFYEHICHYLGYFLLYQLYCAWCWFQVLNGKLFTVQLFILLNFKKGFHSFALSKAGKIICQENGFVSLVARSCFDQRCLQNIRLPFPFYQVKVVHSETLEEFNFVLFILIFCTFSWFVHHYTDYNASYQAPSHPLFLAQQKIIYPASAIEEFVCLFSSPFLTFMTPSAKFMANLAHSESIWWRGRRVCMRWVGRLFSIMHDCLA